MRQQSQAAEADLTAQALTKPPQREADARSDPEPPPRRRAQMRIGSAGGAGRGGDGRWNAVAGRREPAARGAVRSRTRSRRRSAPRAKRRRRAGAAVLRRCTGWAVQLGSFASRDNAERLAQQLKAQGFQCIRARRRRQQWQALSRSRRPRARSRGRGRRCAAKLRSAGLQGRCGRLRSLTHAALGANSRPAVAQRHGGSSTIPRLAKSAIADGRE